MEELYKLKDMLCDELESYGKKKELTAGSLDVIDKLSHALKSITTVIAMEEADGEYSNDYPMNGRTYRGSSYARGRMNARRDSMGRYSRDGYSGAVDDMVSQLKDLMEDAPNESIKSEMHRLVKKIETM